MNAETELGAALNARDKARRERDEAIELLREMVDPPEAPLYRTEDAIRRATEWGERVRQFLARVTR